jgi:serine/threonine protein kinase
VPAPSPSERAALIDHAYLEFLDRREAGEDIDTIAFCNRFPECRSSLFRLLGMHEQFSRLSEQLPPAAHWPSPGDRLGDLTLGRELGRGAFARVFLATEGSAGNRPVVVKLSPCGEAEGHTLGRLPHRAIVPILWCRPAPGTGLTVVCMPYLGSATLQDVLHHLSSAGRRHAAVLLEAVVASVEPDDPAVELEAPHPRLRHGSFASATLHIGLELAEALAVLHRRGVCHRDLKPSNVLLGVDGQPRLLDFNLAVEQAGRGQRLGGTLYYAAPEQVRALLHPEGDVPLPGERADLFSLAVILWELLTGTHPFGPEPDERPLEALGPFLLARQEQCCHRLAAGSRDLASVTDLDHAIIRLLVRCLAFDPAQRPASAEELALGLRAYFQPRRRLRRWAVRRRSSLAAAGCGLALAAALAWSAARPSASAEHGPGSPSLVNVSTRYENGRALFREGRYKEAERQFSTLVADRPNDVRARFALGCVRLKRAGAASSEAERFALLLSARDDFLPLVQQDDPLAHVCLAYCLAQAGSHAQAIFHLDAAEKRGLSSTALWNNRAVSRRQGPGEWEASEQDLGKIEGDDRDLSEVAYNRAVLAWRQRVKAGVSVPERALQDARHAAEASNHANAHWLAATLHAWAAADVRRVVPAAPLLGAPAGAALALLHDSNARQALYHARRSLELGRSDKSLATDPIAWLAGHPAYADLRSVQPSRPLPFLAPFGLIDPVRDLAGP